MGRLYPTRFGARLMPIMTRITDWMNECTLAQLIEKAFTYFLVYHYSSRDMCTSFDIRLFHPLIFVYHLP